MERKYLEKRGMAYVILSDWILEMRELGFNNIRGNAIKNRRGDLPEGDLTKLDSKKMSYYNRNMPSYRWPKKYGAQHQERYDIKSLFLE